MDHRGWVGAILALASVAAQAQRASNPDVELRREQDREQAQRQSLQTQPDVHLLQICTSESAASAASLAHSWMAFCATPMFRRSCLRGGATDICVMATLQDTMFLGYDALLLTDCVASSMPQFCVEAVHHHVEHLYGFLTFSLQVQAGLNVGIAD